MQLRCKGTNIAFAWWGLSDCPSTAGWIKDPTGTATTVLEGLLGWRHELVSCQEHVLRTDSTVVLHPKAAILSTLTLEYLTIIELSSEKIHIGLGPQSTRLCQALVHCPGNSCHKHVVKAHSGRWERNIASGEVSASWCWGFCASRTTPGVTSGENPMEYQGGIPRQLEVRKGRKGALGGY